MRIFGTHFAVAGSGLAGLMGRNPKPVYPQFTVTPIEHSLSHPDETHPTSMETLEERINRIANRSAIRDACIVVVKRQNLNNQGNYSIVFPINGLDADPSHREASVLEAKRKLHCIRTSETEELFDRCLRGD